MPDKLALSPRSLLSPAALCSLRAAARWPRHRRLRRCIGQPPDLLIRRMSMTMPEDKHWGRHDLIIDNTGNVTDRSRRRRRVSRGRQEGSGRSFQRPERLCRATSKDSAGSRNQNRRHNSSLAPAYDSENHQPNAEETVGCRGRFATENDAQLFCWSRKRAVSRGLLPEPPRAQGLLTFVREGKCDGFFGIVALTLQLEQSSMSVAI